MFEEIESERRKGVTEDLHLILDSNIRKVWGEAGIVDLYWLLKGGKHEKSTESGWEKRIFGDRVEGRQGQNSNRNKETHRSEGEKEILSRLEMIHIWLLEVFAGKLLLLHDF